MSEGMKKLIKDLSDGKNISLENIDALVNKYHLSLEERQLLETKDEDDLTQLGLKRQGLTVVLTYNHSCLCGPHTLPTYIVSDKKEIRS